MNVNKVGLLGVLMIFGMMVSFSVVSATSNSVVDEINITVPISCSLTGTGMNTHNAEIPNGTYTADIGTTTLKAFCNDNEGFAIYAAGYTGNEIGGTNSNKLVGTAASSNATIVTGTATSAGNPDISNWAMKLTLGTDSGDTTGTNALTIDSAPNVDLPSQAEQGATSSPFSSYHVVPNEYVKVAHKNSATSMDETNGGVTLTTTYATYISKTQAADTYSGQVIYTLVHPADHAAPVYLNPNADNISEVDYMQQFAVVSDANRNAIIASMVPEQQYTVRDSRDNKTYTIAKYELIDSGSNFDSAEDYINSCYQSGSYVTSDCDNTIYSGLPDDWKAYVDSYDNVNDEFDESLHPITYDVWMTQNLDLDIDSSITYTNKDTDLGYNTATGEYNTASWTPIRSTYQTTTYHTHEWCINGTWSYGNCINNSTPESYDPGDIYWNGREGTVSNWNSYLDSCELVDNIPSCDESVNPFNTTTAPTSSVPQYHLGNYYNWAAAIATNDANAIYGAYNENTEEFEYGVANQSICPAGWTLPRTGESNDSFYALWSKYQYDVNDGQSLLSDPLYLTKSGFYYGVLAGVGGASELWTAFTRSGQNDTERGAFSASIDYSDYDNYTRYTSSTNRSDGIQIRCIVRPVTNLIRLPIG